MDFIGTSSIFKDSHQFLIDTFHTKLQNSKQQQYANDFQTAHPQLTHPLIQDYRAICFKTSDSLKMFLIDPENGLFQITVPISFVAMRHCYLNKMENSKDCIPNKYNLLQKIFNCPSRSSFKIQNKKVHTKIFIAVRSCFSKRIKYKPQLLKHYLVFTAIC